MWKSPIARIDGAGFSDIVKAIENLSHLGCDIVRFSVPDTPSAHSLLELAEESPLPLVADIHYDARFALECLKGAVSVIRINPGNIREEKRIREIAQICKDRGKAIRVGVNSGSLPKDLQSEVDESRMAKSDALCKAALREVELLENEGFYDYVISLKASGVQDTIKANEAFAEVCDAPLHIGVTEAGPPLIGTVKSTYALSHLLSEGIGDTIRVSLSSPPEDEVIAGNEILKVCGLRRGKPDLVSCPRCGRRGFDVHAFVNKWQERILSLDKEITVAVMGCAVNGIGEGKDADIGITGGGDKCIIFKRGKIVRTVDPKDADRAFEEELKSLL